MTPDTATPPAPPAVSDGGGVGEGITRCAACDARLAGPYCHACGERRPRPEDERLWPFLREQFHEVTSADGKLWRTLRALFVPGKLTEEYFAGRRGLYVRPVRIFLVINILFFVWFGFAGASGVLGDASFYRGNYRFEEVMEAAAAGVSAETYDAAFSARARALAPTLIAVFVPVYAVFLALALFPARRSLAHHAVFATHFTAVLMALLALVTAALYAPIAVVQALTADVLYNLDDSALAPIMVVALSAYLVVGLRRVHDLPWWGASAAGLATATLGTLLAMEAYRTVLFFVTVWTVDLSAPP